MHGVLFFLVLVCITTSAFRPHVFRLRSTKLASVDSFDFSSRSGWDGFYDGQGSQPYEWHSSISHSIIAQHLVPGDANILVLGCGTSTLSADLYDEINTAKITSLDYSTNCIELMKQKYENTGRPGLSFICGDAIKLETLDHPEPFTSIVDKGLVDAIMTGDAWDTAVTDIFKGASSVLSYKGSYILVSYNLSTSAKNFFNNLPAFTFTFNLPGSNDRVSISRAVKI